MQETHRIRIASPAIQIAKNARGLAIPSAYLVGLYEHLTKTPGVSVPGVTFPTSLEIAHALHHFSPISLKLHYASTSIQAVQSTNNSAATETVQVLKEAKLYKVLLIRSGSDLSNVYAGCRVVE